MDIQVFPESTVEQVFNLVYPSSKPELLGHGGFNVVFDHPMNTTKVVKFPNFLPDSELRLVPGVFVSQAMRDQVSGPVLRDHFKGTGIDVLTFEFSQGVAARAGMRSTTRVDGTLLEHFLIKFHQAIYQDGAFPKLRAQIARLKMNRRLGNSRELLFEATGPGAVGQANALEELDFALVKYFGRNDGDRLVGSPRMIFGENGLPIIEEVFEEGKLIRQVKVEMSLAGVDLNANNIMVVPDGDDFRLVIVDF